MRALLYGDAERPPDPAALDGVDPAIAEAIARQPVSLVDWPDPVVDSADHVLCAPRLAGVCGSDARLLLGRFSEGDLDNPLAAFTALPFVLGHEAVADVLEAGERAHVREGDRVVLDPWLGCVPRGLASCPACAAGLNSQCERFLDPGLGPGLHVGVAGAVPGAFATRFVAHASQLHAVPDSVSDAAAVLADPFCVSLHAILRTPPPPGGRALVIGAGALGTMAVAQLRRAHGDVGVAVLYRYAHQADAVARLGAHLAVTNEPREAAVEELSRFAGGVPRAALTGLPMSYPGGFDVVYDTIGSAETLELAVRVTRMRGAVVVLGVATPARFEWTPIYFKELRIVGSSGFGVETVGGTARHAIAHYLDSCAAGLDLSWLVTHVEPLDRWTALAAAIAQPATSGVLKAALAPEPTRIDLPAR